MEKRGQHPEFLKEDKYKKGRLMAFFRFILPIRKDR
jgi:hypothetical protein